RVERLIPPGGAQIGHIDVVFAQALLERIPVRLGGDDDTAVTGSESRSDEPRHAVDQEWVVLVELDEVTAELRVAVQLCHARQLVESAHTHVSSFLPIPSRIARPIWRVILLGSKNDACARCPRPRTLSERPTRQWSGRVTVARGHGCRAGSGATIRVVAEDLDPLLERFASTLRLAQSALEEARE